MIRTPVFFGNWKMNLGPTEARAYVASFLRSYTPRTDRTVALFPPALSLETVHVARGGRSDVALGIQNIHHEAKGAFTGESSAPMARDAGARFVLVGHSERRHLFGETDVETARKCEAAHACSLVPVLCVGETLAQRERDETADVVERQLRTGLSRIGADAIAAMVIAYEPVWAIGTGRSATPADATTTHAVIRRVLQELAGSKGEVVPIAYGGSVSRTNADALLAAEGVDGLLVGGACLDPEGWAAICQLPVPVTRP